VKNGLIIVLVVLVIALLFRGCLKTNFLNEKINNLEQQAIAINSDFEKQRKENGELEVKISSFVSDNIHLQEQLKSEKLKKLQSKVVYQTSTTYDTILVNIHDTLIVEKGDTVTKRSFEHKNKWISFKGEVFDHIVSINELVIHDSLDVQIGKEKDGLFKTKDVVLISSKNPNTDIYGAKSFQFNEKKKWYERGGWKFLAGSVLTLILISQL
jgi:major membrane immunogen (membrane-anchored lipoprotein)